MVRQGAFRVGILHRGHDLCQVGRQDDSELVGVGFRRGREAVADAVDEANAGKELVGLIEEGVLPVFKVLRHLRLSVEVVRDVIERDAGLVVPGVKEVLVVLGIAGGEGKAEPENLVSGLTLCTASTMAS